jgi:hypothetical protein
MKTQMRRKSVMANYLMQILRTVYAKATMNYLKNKATKNFQVNSALFILYTRHFVFGQLKRLKRTKHTYGWCQEFPGNNADELLRE